MGTVSNVLNRPERVRPENRRRVEEAIRELNFVGSKTAIQFRSGKSDLVGVVVPDVGNPFWGDVLRGIESVTDEKSPEHSLLVVSSRQDSYREKRAITSLLERGVDGLILAPVGNDYTDLDNFTARGKRIVTIDRQLDAHSIASVVGNDVLGGSIAATHLMDRGHRRIVFVNGPQTVAWSRDRWDGAVAAVEKAGRGHQTELTSIEVPDLTAVNGEAAVPEVLKRLPRGGAVLCANDLVALGVLNGLLSAGFDVPHDFSVVGYDDVEFASRLSPSLTTIKQSPFDMGVVAAQLLLEDADGKPRNVVFEPSLVVRGSSAPPSG